MSHMNMDPALTAPQDASFRSEVHKFLQNQAPATMNPTSHAVLANVVMSYLYTSRNPEIARLLLTLHDTYNITTLIAAEDLVEAINTANGTQNAPAATACPTTPNQHVGRGPPNTPQRGIQSPQPMHFNSPPGQMQSPPNSSVYPLWPLDNSSPGHGQHAAALTSNTPPGPNPYSSAFPSSSSPGQTQYPSAFHFSGPPGQTQGPNTLLSNSPPRLLRRCFPAGLVRECDTQDRDLKWCYKCDECHHPTVYRSEFNRHANLAGREGFKVVASNSIQRVWYAVDALGNEYTGEMIPADERPPGPRHVGEPCKARISQYNANKKREKAAATNKGGGN